MIKTVKASLSEKVLFLFLICLSIFAFTSFFLLKNKCLSVEKIDIEKINFSKPENIAIMNIECGDVVIELYPEMSPNSVIRFKTLINKGLYNGSAFYKVIENTLVQAGDLEYGNKEYLDYSKIGSGQSKLGTLKSELNNEYEFTKGSVGFARSTEFNTEDSEFFITLKEIPIYQGEYTPLGKVIYGLDILEKIKTGNKTIYVLRPDFINSFKMLNAN